ncbi:MAG: ABC transporter ATP-binding protein [Fervidobacterium sp.]|uniref:Iron(III) transport system ATP-binding protein n=1 Tax=Fervidobacterium gondwanense DSM 13020 TaxID=1121883 RepID=A0A1M7RXA5_FERGO|nr:ABC transporter ATP-binding protein [Fervidobacterium gondwanense]SHN50913.1 iron(III) transport system ATP-binding protein [Fervidobacterium gondwanense DSM 13020]
MKQVSLKLINVSKVFKDFKGNEVRAVDNVSFDVQPGEFVTLLGPSGCGKTTTLRMIAGFEKPTDGMILINNVNVVEIPPWKRDTAMVFQSYGLFPHMNVAENIAYGLKMRKVPPSDIEKKVKNILKVVGLEGYGDRPPSSLSGGQQQRVALARALVVEPSVLLFDEPLSNLDVLLREQMRIEIKRIQKEVGITAIYVTHDRTEALTLSDKIVLMKGGKIEQIGSPEEIYEKPVSKFAAEFMGKINFFPVEIVERLEDRTVIKLNGQVYTIPSLPTSKSEKYVLGCRPEGLKIASKGPVKGVIKTIVYLGNFSEYYIDTEFGEVMVKVLPPFDTTLSEGKEVHIDIVPEIAKIIQE